MDAPVPIKTMLADKRMSPNASEKNEMSASRARPPFAVLID
jgi:hypothetical protein